jgi:hypothetical protein
VTNMSATFRDATAFNQSLGTWDISSATNMGNMLNNVGMDCTNYDATLVGWEAQGVTGLSLGATGLTYDIGLAARTSLTTTLGWTISGDTHIAGCNLSALPIELLSFEANLEERTVYLDWQTDSEINNDYFTVQRSKSGITWEDVMDVDGAGNSSTLVNYSAIDSKPNDGISYYRLKQTDFDGQFEFSKTISMNFNKSKNQEIQIYPNPVEDELKVQFKELPKSIKSAHIKIINSNGQVLHNFDTGLESYQILKIGYVKELVPALYILSVELDNGDKVLQEFIKK